jgi:hypothetical protein
MPDNAGGFVSTQGADSVLKIHRTDCENAAGKMNKYKPSMSQAPARNVSAASVVRKKLLVGFILLLHL